MKIMGFEKTRHQEIFSDWQSNRQKVKGPYLRLLQKVKKRKPDFNQLVAIHEEVFKEVDCLKCANCCKTAHPIFSRTDIKRISSYMGTTESAFELQYLQADNEGDYFPKAMPCPFLADDNNCRIYDVRPKSCRSFPHTDSKDGWERPEWMAKNTISCPAAFEIVKRIALRFPG